MIKKVLLIEPPTTRPKDFDSKKVRIGVVPPLGLAYIASVLEHNHIEVRILDCLIEGDMNGTKYKKDKIRYGMSDEEISNYIKIYKPDIVGISCLISAKVYDMLNICRIVKLIDKNIVTCTGGVHPTIAYNEVLEDENLDFVVLGEGEYTFLALVNGINDNNYQDIDGIAYKDNNTIHYNPKTIYIENLDELPLPARHLLNMDKYLNTTSPHSGIKNSPYTSMITSRGCPFNCGFCVIRNLWGSKPRYRSPENILKEIEQLVTTYGIKEIHFEDDNLTADRERAIKIFQGIIDNNFKLTLNSPSGLAIHTLDKNLLTLMKEAGYYSISVAIESGDKDVLKLMRKPVDLQKAKDIIKISRDLGMKTKGFFILGYPGETKEQMNRTVEYASTVGLDWALFFIATPIPGSELEKYCIENDYLINKHLDYIKHFYISNIKTNEFDPQYVEALKEKANLEINFKNNINITEGKWDRAIEDIGEVVKLYPHLSFPHYYLGVAYQGRSFDEFIKAGELGWIL